MRGVKLFRPFDLLRGKKVQGISLEKGKIGAEVNTISPDLRGGSARVLCFSLVSGLFSVCLGHFKSGRNMKPAGA